MTDMPPYLSTKDEKNSEQSDSEESSEIDDWDLPSCFDKPRHLELIKGADRVEHSWRVKEKYKTHCVALVLCLNVGVDPPDVVKTQPCARLECWIDPNSLSTTKALESIGHALQLQYERWQPRARYKQSLDPTSDEVKKLCCSLRRNAKDERVLFHYNGHGVPKPTAQGEIWVFNRSYTQYIPLSMYDLQSWMGSPSLYVYDCSNAGVILDHFRLFADQHEREYEAALAAKGAGEGGVPPGGGGAMGGAGAGSAGAGGGGGGASYRNCIQLAACAAGQTLPQHPELPADLFTACLTTPVKMAMKWFVLRAAARVAPPHVHDLIDKIPGQVTDRRTMLGELNWIFTAITDTIAWSSLPADLFQQLFRADLLTASLCRNFLLADRIMRSYNCTPVAAPALPSLARHPLWAAWEHTLDLALAQLPALLGPQPPAYAHSPFFRDQLTAFQVWLELGCEARRPPLQLPMVLQVLLSTLHRVRALQLLCRFLALGAWAARAVLAVGIFPYMLKLLQASAPDLRASMVYIWARIVHTDPSCQVDLVNAKGHKYFLSILQDPTVDSEHRTLAAYVLAGIVDNYPAGQEAALQGSMISICLEQLVDESPLLRQWACISLGRLWRGYDAARWAGVRDLAHEKLYPLLLHRQPEVRAACAFALGTFVAGGGRRTDQSAALDQQTAVVLAARPARDASPLVRRELLAALQWLVLTFEQHFIAVYIQERVRKSDKERTRVRSERGTEQPDRAVDALSITSRSSHSLTRSPGAQPLLPNIGFGSVYMKVWRVLQALAREPLPAVADPAADILAYIGDQVDNVAREMELRSSGGSSSLPPSPNTRPALHHHSTLPGCRRGKAGLPHTISEDPVGARELPRDRDSSSSTTSTGPPVKKAIVRTWFVEWAAEAFGARADAPDVEARAHHQRAWRAARNRSLRHHAQALRSARVSRLETQAFHSRCPLPPAVVQFHPYDQHLAVASKDNFGIWDWGTAAKLCVGTWRRAWGRISALQFLNAHHHALLAAASHSGHLALYRPSNSITEPALVSAWKALDVRVAADYRPPPAQPLISLAQLVSEQFVSAEERLPPTRDAAPRLVPGASASGSPTSGGGGGGAGGGAVGGGGGAGGGAGGAGGYASTPPPTLLRWCGRRATLLLAGAAPLLRLWDAESELLHSDIPTNCEAAVTSLWRGVDGSGGGGGPGSGPDDAWMVVAGFGDGTVRVWDERDARQPVYSVRADGAVRAADLRRVVCAEGTIRLVDARRAGAATAAVRTPGPVAAADIHPLADLIACGSVNQCISIYDQSGAHLNSIKFHEGFMGARIGPVACLAFHPLRVAMGVGCKDSSVCVYVSEPRR